MGISDKGASAAIKVCEVVAEEVHGCFALWEWAEAHAVHVELHRPGSQTKLEAVKELDIDARLFKETYSSALIQPSSSARAATEEFSASAPAAATCPDLS